MGLIYAYGALGNIVAEHPEGLTKEEVFEINQRTYQAAFDQYFDYIDPDPSNTERSNSLSHQLIEFRDGKYFLKRGQMAEDDIMCKVTRELYEDEKDK